jgi:glycosyltransferase involved in cell wall biosynthesis
LLALSSRALTAKDFPMPRLYGLLIARDEADVIEQSLTHALKHCDKIICMDNNSRDVTWVIVQAMAARHPGRIVAHRLITERFHDRLRALAYNAFHHELTATDWWLRLDADEFLHEPPAEVLLQANAEEADFVRAYQMTFALTDVDVAAIERGEDDRHRSIEERRRHYKVDWREFRLFRNSPTTPWDVAVNPQFPQNLSKGRVASRTLYNRHYQNRDIAQVSARIALRAENASFAHVGSTDWRQYVTPARQCHHYVPGAPVQFAPLADFWLPRLKLELGQRLGRLARPA